MTVVQYLDKIFVELTTAEIADIDEPILVYKNKYYLELKTFFRLYYHLDIKHPYITNGDEVYLIFYLTSITIVEDLYNIMSGIKIQPELICENDEDIPRTPAIKVSMFIDF